MNNKYKDIFEAIVFAQQSIIGPLALEVSSNVTNIDKPDKNTVENLVLEYQKLFGQASVETCKDALRSIDLTGLDLPSILTD